MGLKETLKKSFTKKDILTIPNLLSVLRLCLIPVILWLYNKKHQYAAAAAVVLLSGITDLLDGWIARRFHMISNFGKFLDPLADKLTQGAMMLCLWERYPWIIWVLAFFALKELVQLICVSISILSPIKSIRAKCLECSCGNMAEVNHCQFENCPLYPYRLGKNPSMKRECTPAQLEALRKGRVPFRSVDNISDSAETATR